MRASMLEVLNLERADSPRQGLDETGVITRHVPAQRVVPMVTTDRAAGGPA